LYGAIIIDPKDKDPVAYDRDYVVTLSDWSDEQPEAIYEKLKKLPHYYNTRERTVNDLYQDIKNKGVRQTWNEREMWNEMRMSDRDISDVTGWTYTFLMNGHSPDQNWSGLFKKGERIRLRFINAAAMTFFDVRIPGLKMTVVASDGQAIEPVTVDEFRMGVAETYDVIVEPDSDCAYTVFAQAIDRSGYARGTLTADRSINALIPDMDPAPVLTHADMGMGHSGMGHSSMQHSMEGMNHSMPMNHAMHDLGPKQGSGLAGFGSAEKIIHPDTEWGPHIDMRADMPQSKLDDPGIGLRDHQKRYGRKVLTYADIKNRYRTLDPREPGREIQLHLTGNMDRYMWSINGIKFADAEPLRLKYGERVRITLVNDTMMNHPIHLHGMWSELETGDANYIPRKHTVIVQPGSKISYLVTADAKGRWAYHCHLLYHMLGMFREVAVS
jgi:CopA family copper-resistance protein